MLEVFNNLFMSIAEQMGVALQNTAYSVNIKERLDFSCAVFDGDGSLVANAPHMPVHLGSMDRAVETIIRENKGRIAPGDVYAINAPYNGGTHLPDITVCTPVFDEPQRSCSGSPRAAIMPMSAASRRARCRRTRRRSRQEGVYIDNFKLVDRGRFREKEFYGAADRAKYPARNPVQNINDLKAQIAANEKGVQELRKMVRAFTLPVVQRLYAARAGQCRRKRAACHRPAARFVVHVRDGPRHRHQGASITVDKKKREATVDFTGTSAQQPTNFNAPDQPAALSDHPLGVLPLLSPSHDPSFPSDHATAAFAIAFGILFVTRRTGWLFLAWAVLIGISRVLAGMHFPTDVLAGAVVGLAAGCLRRASRCRSLAADPVRQPDHRSAARLDRQAPSDSRASGFGQLAS